MKNRGKRTLAIWALVIALCSVTVAYAVLQTTLSISGSALRKGVQYNWDVKISNFEWVSGVKPSIPTISGTSLTFTLTLEKPGDYSIMKVTLTNDGDVDAATAENSGFLHINGTSSSSFRMYVEDPTTWGGSDNPATSDNISCVYSTNSSTSFDYEHYQYDFLNKLYAGTSRSFYIKCKYDDVDTIPKDDVNISISYSIDYYQCKDCD